MVRRRAQQGVTLVVTLIILVVITIVGVAALRGSSLSLAIATNSQIRATTFQAAQEGLRLIERTTNADIKKAMSADGLILPAINNPGTEQRHCLSRSSAAGLRAGTCQVATGTDYLTMREATLVQAVIVAPQGAGGKAKTLLVEGEEAGEGIPPTQVNLQATAVMPALGSASAKDIQDCLALPVDPPAGGGPSMSACLAAEGATYSAVVGEYCYGACFKAEP